MNRRQSCAARRDDERLLQSKMPLTEMRFGKANLMDLVCRKYEADGDTTLGEVVAGQAVLSAIQRVPRRSGCSQNSRSCRNWG
jgi:hypothetical protein